MAISKIIKLEGANIPLSCKQICKMIKQNKISFDNVVQRSYVWENKRRSELIWSIIMGYPIPPMYAKRGETDNNKIKVYDILDGQQRSVTLYKFTNDEFALSDLKPIPYLDEEGEEQKIDISGLKFSELDEEIQDVIMEKTFTIYYFDDLLQTEQAEMFRRLNNGKPLTAKNRTLAACVDIEKLLDIGAHELFKEMLTEKALDNKNQVSIIMKIWCMMNLDIANISFESKYFNPLMETTEISEEERLKMVQVFDLIMNTHTVLTERKEKRVYKKLYTETHIVSLVPYFAKAIEDGIDEERMSDWLIEFFKPIDGDTSISEEYNNATGAGSAKNMNIQIRNRALADSFAEFFKVDGNEDSETLIPDEGDVQDGSDSENE